MLLPTSMKPISISQIGSRFSTVQTMQSFCLLRRSMTQLAFFGVQGWWEVKHGQPLPMDDCARQGTEHQQTVSSSLFRFFRITSHVQYKYTQVIGQEDLGMP